MTPTDKKHYTVPEFVAYDIVENPPPPGMMVNCISCYGVSRQGLPDAHTVAWYPLFKTPASAKERARIMTRTRDPDAPPPVPFVCACGCTSEWRDECGPWHRDTCPKFIPF